MRMKFGLTVCLVATGLAAQGPEGQHWIQGKVAYVKPDSSCNCIKDDVGAGAGVGTWFTPRWGLELDALALALKSRTGAIDVHEQHLLVSGLFNLAPHAASWFPYLRAGVGGTRVPSPYSLSQETLNRVSWHGGAGVQHFFGTRGLVSLEARSVTIDTAERRVEYQGLLGLGWRWGGAAAAVAAVLPAPVPVPAPAPPVTPAPPAPPPPVAPPRPPMPAPAPVPAAPPVVAAPAPPNLVIVLDDALLHFANGKALLSPQGVEAIRKVAASLKAYPGVYDVTVTGHTSSLGARAFNLGLSKRRAEAVAAILVQEGIPAARVASQGMGPDHPKADNATVEGQAHNRRVEIEVKGVNVEVRHHLTGLQH